MKPEDPMIRGMRDYVCHKRVGALQIAAAERLEDGSVKLVFSDHEASPITMDSEWGCRFKPELPDGEYDPGYLVRYEDGYLSWSPTKAFEDGYTLI